MSSFKWKKRGLIFDTAKANGPDWMCEFAQAPCVLPFPAFIRVYFSCRPKPDARGQYTSYSGFVDLDRKNLFNILKVSQEPILKLGKTGTFDEFGTYPCSVIEEGKRILVYYGGWTRCESVPFNVAIGLGISKNGGITFEKAGEGPVISYSPDEPFVISGPKIRKYNGLYYLWYIAGKKWIPCEGKAEPVYRIRMAQSPDGINWSKAGKDIIPSRIEEDEAQASPDVFYKNSKYHMFFCYRHSLNYRGKEKGYRIGYAYSTDLLNWTRNDERAGIDISETGWDSEMISYPHVFELDGRIYMFYLGNQVGRQGFGMAELEGTLE